MTEQSLAIHLELLLREMYEAICRLNQVLEDEYTALCDKNTDQLQATTVNKLDLTDEIEKLEKQRAILLQSRKLPLSNIGMYTFIHQLDNGVQASLNTQWSLIEKLIRECEEQNRINGIMVEDQKRYIQSALSILSGKSLITDTYDAKGSTTNQDASTHILARA